MILELVDSPERGFALLVQQANRKMQELLDCEAPEAGTPLEYVFKRDVRILERWTEFLMKARYLPQTADYDEMVCGDCRKSYLVFLLSAMCWKLCRVWYSPQASVALVEMEDPADDRVTVSHAHWREMMMQSCLARYMAGDLCWDMDLRTRQVFLTEELAGLLALGQSDAVVEVSRFLEAIHPGDMEEVLREVVHGQVAANLRVVTPAGTEYLKVHAVPVRGKNAEIERVLGCMVDMTQHEAVAEKLTVCEERFSRVMESSSDVFFLMDAQGIISFAATGVFGILGRTAREVVGKKCSEFLVDDESRRAFQRFLDEMAGNRRVRGKSVEIRVRHLNGSTLWMRVNVSVIRDRQGRVAEVSAVCRDITREKHQSEKLMYMVRHDMLCDVYNRFCFDEELVHIEQENTTGVGILVADVNGLKTVNEAFGHGEGNQMLKETAALLRKVAGQHMVARVGGDEFAVIAYNSTLPELQEMCEQVQAACDETHLCAVPLSISCGCAHYEEAQEHVRELFEKAEERMCRKKMLENRSLRSHFIASLRETLRSHHLETTEHMQRIEQIAVALGQHLELYAGEMEKLVLLASLHDLGKVAIPDSIINKPSRLDSSEWRVMQSHSEVGARIAQSSSDLACIAPEIRAHHERWDGTGYPDGLRGADIPILSRVVSVADSYDVMTNRRPYKEPISHAAALRELQECAGSQFDPQVVGLFVDIFEKRGAPPIFMGHMPYEDLEIVH